MQLNTQPPEPQQRKADGNTLAVNSIFYTIQGEGPFAGNPAVFIRLAGCNLQCPMCDTEYTKRKLLTVDQITAAVNKAWCDSANVADTKHYLVPIVVITGGEPFRQNLGPLVNDLLGLDIRVQIETNGTLPISDEIDPLDGGLTIVCSPKAGKINRKLAPHVHSFKYVANVDSLAFSTDGLPTHALEHPNSKGLARPPEDWEGVIYLQPVDEQDDERNKANTQAVVASCLRNGYRLCLQMHKIVGVE